MDTNSKHFVSLADGRTVRASSSLNSSSSFGYIRGFLSGRGSADAYQELLSLSEAYEDVYSGIAEDGELLIDGEIIRSRRVIELLIALYESQNIHLRRGSKVLANGYPGIITQVHDGDEQLDGMVEVKLASGEIIVPRYELTAL